MVDFLSPKITVRELPSIAGTTPSTSPSIPIIIFTATRGPLDRPITVTSLADFESVFGVDDGAYGWQSANGFFGNGGRRLVGVRASSLASPPVSAETTVLTLGSTDGAASKTSSIGPFNLHPAAIGASPFELIAPIDGAAADTMALAISQGKLLAPGPPVGSGNVGDTIDFDVTTPAGTVVHVFTAVGTPTTPADWVAEITAQIPGISIDIVAGALQAVTDGYGSAFNVGISAGAIGTALADSGFAIASGAAGSGVVDAEAVTNAELAPLIDAAWTGGTGVVSVANPDGSITTTTVATGVSASIGVVSGNLAAAIGFSPAGVVVGVASGVASVPTLKFLATSEGAHGNTLAVTTFRRDRIVANVAVDIPAAPVTEMIVDTALAIRPGMQLFVEDLVTTGTLRAIVAQAIGNRVIFTGPVTPTAVITAANDPGVTKETFDVTFLIDGDPIAPFSDLSMASEDVRFFIGNVIGLDVDALDPRQRIFTELQSAPLSNTEDPRPVNVVAQALAGGIDSGVLSDTDWIGTPTNGKGIEATGASTVFSMMAIPGVETVAVHRALMDKANAKKRHVAIINTPAGQTDQEAFDYITITANLFGTYTIVYAGELLILRASSGAQESFPTSGYICGIYARNDQTDNVASPPAGVRKGQFRGVLGAANANYWGDESRRDTIYPTPGINTVWNKEGAGVVAWGQLTLDPTSDRGAIGVRRALISLERDIELLSDFVLFELNTDILRVEYTTRTSGFLRQRWRDGVLQGANEREAYTIVCDESNNPASVVNARQFYADIGVNVIPGIDYAVINIFRDARSLEEELAAA